MTASTVRSRKASPDLNRERIAEAGLAIADERGVEGFTIRAVADRLGVTPMALYHHVADKAELARLVVDAAISETPMPASTGEWKEDLWLMARWVRERGQAHPSLSRLRSEHKVWTPSMLRLTERWFSLWRQSGLDLKKSVAAASASSMAVTGLVSEETVIRQMDRPDPRVLEQIPDAGLLFNAQTDPDAMFELAVRAVIDGVQRRVAAS